jgi:DNA-binding XRE family transcriptional regulator
MLRRAIKQFSDNVNLSDLETIATNWELVEDLRSLAEAFRYRRQFDSLGKNCRRMRQELGMTVDELTELSGVDRQTIALIENGGIAPDCFGVVNVANIAEALNTTMDRLLL